MKKIFKYIVALLFAVTTIISVKMLLKPKNEELIMKDKPIVVIKTTQGPIKIELNSIVAPLACENFIGLAAKKYYDGQIFHRVIKGFMIQGGDPTGTGRGGESIWGKPFKDELPPHITFDKPGLLAMANAGPNTNGSQFFITTAKTPWLSGKHTIFGRVIEGYDVVTKIENAAVGHGDKPIEEQKIISITVESE